MSLTPRLGEVLICTGPGSTLLVKGESYTVADITPDDLLETAELRGFLFGSWRFKRPHPDTPNRSDGAQDASAMVGSGAPPKGGAA